MCIRRSDIEAGQSVLVLLRDTVEMTMTTRYVNNSSNAQIWFVSSPCGFVCNAAIQQCAENGSPTKLPMRVMLS
jgi:hypothetical protein